MDGWAEGARRRRGRTVAEEGVEGEEAVAHLVKMATRPLEIQHPRDARVAGVGAGGAGALPPLERVQRDVVAAGDAVLIERRRRGGAPVELRLDGALRLRADEVDVEPILPQMVGVERERRHGVVEASPKPCRLEVLRQGRLAEVGEARCRAVEEMVVGRHTEMRGDANELWEVEGAGDVPPRVREDVVGRRRRRMARAAARRREEGAQVGVRHVVVVPVDVLDGPAPRPIARR